MLFPYYNLMIEKENCLPGLISEPIIKVNSKLCVSYSYST
jgi:hypothetical protein